MIRNEKNLNKLVLSDPRFKSIVSRKWRLSFGLSAGMTAIYAVFVLVIVFKRSWLLLPVTSANPFNTGLMFTLIMLLVIIVSMFCYLFFKGNDRHDDIHELVAEHNESQTDNSG